MNDLSVRWGRGILINSGGGWGWEKDPSDGGWFWNEGDDTPLRVMNIIQLYKYKYIYLFYN